MQGLRTRESEKFNRFWEIVQKEADLKGCVFFADCGEGRPFETSEMEGEDFCGWLIPKERVETFIDDWEADQVSDAWLDFMVWMAWVEEDITSIHAKPVKKIRATFEKI